MALRVACSADRREGGFMKEKSTWERFFDAHASIYEDNVFTKNTVLEVDFILEEWVVRTSACPRNAWIRQE
jgi:hypothetical protein